MIGKVNIIKLMKKKIKNALRPIPVHVPELVGAE